jgi:hypothetical protein
MSESTLDPDNFPAGKDRSLGKGHGTGALGPSDTSDSGSDVQGGTGLADEELLDLQRGTNEDPGGRERTAGPDLGDAGLDSDSDAGGTGERGAAGRDAVQSGADIDTDHIETIPADEEAFVDEGMKEGNIERAAIDRERTK